MKLKDVIYRFDREIDSTADDDAKVNWISKLDLMINREVLEPRGIARDDFEGYGEDMEAQVLAPGDFRDMYIRYMEAQWFRGLHEDAGYNRAANAFNTEYLAYADWINRHHMARRTPLRIV